jgi:hypothetical protein
MLRLIKYLLQKRSNEEKEILKLFMNLIKTAKITEYTEFSNSCGSFRGTIQGRRMTVSRDSIYLSTKSNKTTLYIDNYPFAYPVIKKKIKLMNEFQRKCSKEKEEKILLNDLQGGLNE